MNPQTFSSRHETLCLVSSSWSHPADPAATSVLSPWIRRLCTSRVWACFTRRDVLRPVHAAACVSSVRDVPRRVNPLICRWTSGLLTPHAAVNLAVWDLFAFPFCSFGSVYLDVDWPLVQRLGVEPSEEQPGCHGGGRTLLPTSGVWGFRLLHIFALKAES